MNPHSWRLSAVSGLPLPGNNEIPEPTGGSANLKVLAWAGYKGAFSCTFDDTQPSQIQHWPQIRGTQVRATWYLAPTFKQSTDFDATWQDVLAAGHEIGNHTEHHYYVSQLVAANFPGVADFTVAAAAAQELDRCDDYIRNVIGQNGVWTMAYPYGDTGWKTFLNDRYLFARTVHDGHVTPNQDIDPLLLPTYTVNAGDNQATFAEKIDQAADSGAWRTILFHSLLPTADDWYAGVPVGDVVGAIEYGKDKGLVWLDSVVNVGAYWTAARLLGAAQPVQRGDQFVWNWRLPRHFPRGKYLRVTVGGGRLSQNGDDLIWDPHGFYEVALDAGSLTWRPSTRRR